MVLDAVANFVRGTTVGSVDNSQTTVAVDDASIFPDPSVQGEFNVVMWDAANFPRPDQDPDVEILRVTATDTTADEVTVVRGQEATSAAAHPAGSAVHLSPTAKMFGDIEGTFADFWDAGAQELTADVNNESVSTDSLVIGGTLYEEDDNSPFVVTGQSSATYTVADSYDEVVFIPLRDNAGYNQIRVNGDTADNYNYVDRGDTVTESVSEWDLGRELRDTRLMSIAQNKQLDRQLLSVNWANHRSGLTVGGEHDDNSTSIDSVEFIEAGGDSRNFSARVYGRSMNI